MDRKRGAMSWLLCSLSSLNSLNIVSIIDQLWPVSVHSSLRFCNWRRMKHLQGLFSRCLALLSIFLEFGFSFLILQLIEKAVESFLVHYSFIAGFPWPWDYWFSVGVLLSHPSHCRTIDWVLLFPPTFFPN